MKFQQRLRRCSVHHNGLTPPILCLPILHLVPILQIFIPLHQNLSQQSVVGVERRRNEGRGGVSSTKMYKILIYNGQVLHPRPPAIASLGTLAIC
jgi:hypothetical protein